MYPGATQRGRANQISAAYLPKLHESHGAGSREERACQYDVEYARKSSLCHGSKEIVS